ncbi:hydrolase [Lysobacter sp. KIS68-7]|uniref:hydrolase n=1 Tax=Lysobacter sp. KIS68-7 TaxID=2904252 RepID=UPI001E5E2EC3|nr:hydrolase [Lysobacter sp. KIS68-7]UHQ18821.1 hydrolase [Lysobacter sp. KIS68-7]
MAIHGRPAVATTECVSVLHRDLQDAVRLTLHWHSPEEFAMASEPIRDPIKDHLLTPENSAFIVIDYQPIQVSSIRSMDQKELVFNIVSTAKAALNYKLPIVHSTVNVGTGRNKPPIAELQALLGHLPTYDRTTINSWEDVEFRQAVAATGRKKLIMTALWTEACLAFPALDALKEGFDVYAVVDAVGGTSIAAHEAALRRIEQAGASLISKTQLYCELQRDWKREATIPGFMNVFQNYGGSNPEKDFKG